MGSIQSRLIKTGYDYGELQCALGQKAALANERQNLDHAVRLLDKWSDIEIQIAFDGTRVLKKRGAPAAAGCGESW